MNTPTRPWSVDNSEEETSTDTCPSTVTVWLTGGQGGAGQGAEDTGERGPGTTGQYREEDSVDTGDREDGAGEPVTCGQVVNVFSQFYLTLPAKTINSADVT